MKYSAQSFFYDGFRMLLLIFFCLFWTFQMTMNCGGHKQEIRNNSTEISILWYHKLCVPRQKQQHTGLEHMYS